MTLLAAGVLLWTLVHLSPAVEPGIRRSLTGRLGENPYKGLFALSLLLSLALIVAGWRSTVPQHVYLPPVWGRHLAMLLMVVAVILFGAANYPTAIKRYLRHPMLTGMAVWSLAHLLANGDSRSLLLFGGHKRAHRRRWIQRVALNERRPGLRLEPLGKLVEDSSMD